MLEDKALIALLGTVVGATLKGIWDYVGRSQSAELAMLKAYYERVFKERVEDGIDKCIEWAETCVRLAERCTFVDYRQFADKTEAVRCVSRRLDATYGRKWHEVVTMADCIMADLARREAVRADENQGRTLMELSKWLVELEFYRARQLRVPGASWLRVRGWAYVARWRFGRDRTEAGKRS